MIEDVEALGLDAPEARVVARATLDEYLALAPFDPAAARSRFADLAACAASFDPGEDGWPRADGCIGPVAVGGWSDNAFRRNIAERIESAMERDGYSDGIGMVDPGAEEFATLREADRLLSFLLPRTWLETGPLVEVIALVVAGFQSSYVNETPLLVTVNVSMLADCLMAAEVVFHECLHEKLVRIRMTHHLFREGYDDMASAAVLIPWGAGAPRTFSVARAIATHHVYMHLAVLHSMALERVGEVDVLAELGEEEIARRLRRCFNRASHLSAVLTEESAVAEMGSDGPRLVEWIGSATRALEGLALPSGATLVPHPYSVRR